MFIAYINDGKRYGTIFGSFLTMEAAIKLRAVAGDLVFNDDGTINQSQEWLWPWELDVAKSYAREQQANKLDVSAYNWTNQYDRPERQRFLQGLRF